MSCKNKVWSECGNISSRKWDNVCYYKCSDNCCESKKCKKEICEAKEILDRIKNKNDNLDEKDIRTQGSQINEYTNFEYDNNK